jgi:hypothetical protein
MITQFSFQYKDQKSVEMFWLPFKVPGVSIFIFITVFENYPKNFRFLCFKNCYKKYNSNPDCCKKVCSRAAGSHI